MKKLVFLVVFSIMFIVGATASAAGLEKDVKAVKTSLGPMLVKTLEGPELNGLNHQGIEFAKGKGEKGLVVTKSRKEKVNIIVMNAKAVQPFLEELERQTLDTENRGKGPFYRVRISNEKPPQSQMTKLAKLGINQPVIMTVYSDKKAGKNIWGGIAKLAIGFLI